MQGAVKNFMIGPVFGFNKDGTRSDKPNGIIQFINNALKFFRLQRAQVFLFEVFDMKFMIF